MIRFIFINFMLAVAFVAIGCGSSPAKQDGEGPEWWLSQSLSVREYDAEIYRALVATTMWQESLQHLVNATKKQTADDSLSILRKRISHGRSVAADRLRLAMRLANPEDMKWIKRFLSTYLESAMPMDVSADELMKWNRSLPIFTTEFSSEHFLLQFEPGKVLSLQFSPKHPSMTVWQVARNADSLQSLPASGVVDAAIPEPLEERSRMGKLVRSSWVVVSGEKYAERVHRWSRLVETEFDDPHCKLGTAMVTGVSVK